MSKAFLSSVFVLLVGARAWTHPGVGIVIDSRGNVFYTDLKHVWKIAPDGSKSIVVRDVHTHELCLDAQDNLFGEHLWYEGDASGKWRHRVWRLSADGRLVDVIPAREGFLQNYSFVRDRQGNMYWADRGPRTLIRKRTPEGRVTVISEGVSFRDVRWMTSTAGSTIFLIDDGDLRRISPDGAVSTLAKALRERSIPDFYVSGLWTDRQENVYVALYSGQEVKKVEPTGYVTVFARSSLPWSPSGGVFAPDGDLWLLEYSQTNEARVRRISQNGSERIY